jgi:hypothetical protein
MIKKSCFRAVARTAALAATVAALALAGCENAAGPSSEKSILSFSFASPAVSGVIDEAAGTILATTISVCDKTSLTPAITVSAGAGVSPASGVARDFTNPVIYTVTARDGTTREYAVKVRTLVITTDPTSGLHFQILVPAPKNVEATGGARGAVVTWDAVDGATGYEVHYGRGAAATIFDPQAPASAISGCRATVTGLIGGTSYAFAVVAFKGGSESDASASAACYAKLEAPTNLKAVGGPKWIALSWTAPSGEVSGYRIHYRQGDTATISDGLAASAAVNGATASVAGLPDGRTYSFVIEAVRGQLTEVSPPSAVATATTDFVVGQQTSSSGYVFYDKGAYTDGWRYMEVTPGVIYTQEPYLGPYGYSRRPVTSTGIGSGKANTDELIQCFGNLSCAATICRNYGLNECTDWFLPSKDELNEVFMALYKTHPFFVDVDVWTSSTYPGSDSAWIQYFEAAPPIAEGAQLLVPFTNKYAILPVRRF